MANSEIFQVAETPPSRVNHVAQQLGISTTDRRKVLRSLNEHVDDMKPDDAVDFLLGLCESLLVDESGDAFGGFRAMGFTPAEARILSELDRRRGKPVAYGVLESLSNPKRNFETDASQVLKVYLSRIRSNMRNLGCPVEIVTLWGDGYMMKVPQDYRWPWESDK